MTWPCHRPTVRPPQGLSAHQARSPAACGQRQLAWFLWRRRVALWTLPPPHSGHLHWGGLCSQERGSFLHTEHIDWQDKLTQTKPAPHSGLGPLHVSVPQGQINM